jgi:hypothetical protein
VRSAAAAAAAICNGFFALVLHATHAPPAPLFCLAKQTNTLPSPTL